MVSHPHLLINSMRHTIRIFVTLAIAFNVNAHAIGKAYVKHNPDRHGTSSFDKQYDETYYFAIAPTAEANATGRAYDQTMAESCGNRNQTSTTPSHQRASTEAPPNGHPDPVATGNEQWKFSSTYHVVDKGFYRLGKLSKDLDTTNIEAVLDATLGLIKNPAVKARMKQERPIYLVSKSARDFKEFSAGVTGDGRQVLDLLAFGTSKPTPGFLSSDFEGCTHPYYEEDIPFHEFSHTLHVDGMTEDMKAQINDMYNKYKVPSPNYSINSYAFTTELEFFAEMSQVFCEVTVRKDVTAGLDKAAMKAHLPDMYAFLDSLYDLSVNRIKQASCAAPCAKQWGRCAL